MQMSFVKDLCETLIAHLLLSLYPEQASKDNTHPLAESFQPLVNLVCTSYYAESDQGNKGVQH